MSDDNEVESYWDHREGLRPSPVVSQETRDRWNPSGQQIYNLLTRVFANPPAEYISQTENARLISTYLTRQWVATDEYPDYEATRRNFEELPEPGCVQLLDRIVQGSVYSRTLTSGELWEYLRRMYTNTPTSHIPEVDRSISGCILEYCRENHAYPQISVLRGLTISNMRVQERIQDLIVQVGGLNGEIPSPSLPQDVIAPREEGENPSQIILDLRRLALLLSNLQELINSVGDDEHIDSCITELFTWVEAQGAVSHMPNGWWEDTLHNFEVAFRIHRRSVHPQGSHAHDSTAADRRILAYTEQYMGMVGHLPSQAETRAYFTNQNDGHALTRLLELSRNEVPQHERRMSAGSISFGHNMADLELPERRSDEERDYDLRINLRRVALLLEGLIQTSEHMPAPLNLRILHDLQTSLISLSGETFNTYVEPDWHGQTLRDFRVEFLHRGDPGTFPRPRELYPTERHAYPPPRPPMVYRAQERVAEDNAEDAEGPAIGDEDDLSTTVD
jgi:hypothetical protein